MAPLHGCRALRSQRGSWPDGWNSYKSLIFRSCTNVDAAVGMLMQCLVGHVDNVDALMGSSAKRLVRHYTWLWKIQNSNQ